jgi:Zn-dependent M28 family amino/carboxypeptidase
MGSAFHAAALKRQGIPLRAMIALEMIGYFTDAPDSQGFPLPGMKRLYPTRGNFITVAGKLGQGALVRQVKKAMRSASPLGVEAISAPPSLPGVSLSDHRNYWEAGYPAVMITDTAFYRNDNYHTESDTPETLDYKRMAMVVQGLHAAVMGLGK